MKIINGEIIVEHHVTPSSRKANDKIVELETVFHDAYHIVFKNLTVTEAVTFLKIVMRPNTGPWTKKDLNKLRKTIMKGKKNAFLNKEGDCWEGTDNMLQKANIHTGY